MTVGEMGKLLADIPEDVSFFVLRTDVRAERAKDTLPRALTFSH